MNAPEFFRNYALHRAKEGRAHSLEELKQLPYLRSGPLARQWAVRARTYDAFLKHAVKPIGRAVSILDLGAGNGWLSYRLAQMGHEAVALDIRDDDVDGLGAAARLQADAPYPFECVQATFDDIPYTTGRFDMTVFNASLHYAKDLRHVLAEAARVTRSGGLLAVLDSPFYHRAADGEAMIAEKYARGSDIFGTQAHTLLSQNFIEYLTRERLAAAYPAHYWARRRVRYPLRYELRPLIAALKRARTPSRFDLWTARVP
jgi:SAM-dependent methyltransferase